MLLPQGRRTHGRIMRHQQPPGKWHDSWASRGLLNPRPPLTLYTASGDGSGMGACTWGLPWSCWRLHEGCCWAPPPPGIMGRARATRALRDLAVQLPCFLKSPRFLISLPRRFPPPFETHRGRPAAMRSPGLLAGTDLLVIAALVGG